jgi:hypothetical protein
MGTSFNVTWFGGEPLVGKQPLLALSDAFIERCDRAGVSYGAGITTNGFLLDERRSDHRTGAEHHVEHASGHAGGEGRLAERHGDARRRFRRLEHHGITER